MNRLFQVCGCASEKKKTPFPSFVYFLLTQESGVAYIQERSRSFILHFDIGVLLTLQSNAKFSHVKLAVVLSVADASVFQCVSWHLNPLSSFSPVVVQI